MTSLNARPFAFLSHFARAAAFGAALAVAACGASSDDDAAEDAGGAAPSAEDIVNVDDLLVEDTGSGATKVGDPAVWLDLVRQETKRGNAWVKVALGRIGELASTTPVRTGKTPSGEPFSIWRADKDGVTYTLMVARTAENRLRYFLQGSKGGERKPLLTGVFIKRASKRGVGRLHVDLTNLNALAGVPDATGKVHFWFSNGGEARARRLRYREVKPKDLGVEGAINFGVDAIHRPGKGGVLKSYAIGDLGKRIPDLSNLMGVQLAAFRARWTPEGGRLSAAVFDVQKMGGLTKLGDVHECWDGGGIRKAYKSWTGKEDEGDTVDKVACGNLEQDTPPAEAPAEGAPEAEVDAELVEATSISETESSVELDPGT